jgi:co-chaperonin GroES (HSP10)
MFIPAHRHVEVEPFKADSIIIDPNAKYEEMGKIMALPYGLQEYDCGTVLKVGDVIFFDSYACRATPEIDGKKHYVVNVFDGGLLGVMRADHVEGQ